jgi:RNAse (barnase) inhibitor barstar
MNKKELFIDASKFDNIKEFYIEVEYIFTKDLDWKTGRNLDSFDDLLEGGFGVHEYDEPIKIIWLNTPKSKIDLGLDFDVIVEISKEHNNIELVLR